MSASVRERESEPGSELGKALLAAGREESPSPGSWQRAMAGVDAAVARGPRPARSKWLLAGAVSVTAAAAAVLVVWTKGAGTARPPELAATAPTEQQAAPSASATELVLAAPLATASSLDSSSASASASATAVAMGPKLPPELPAPPAAGGKSGAGASASPGAPGSPASARASACGCAPADLLCNMRCSAKK